MFACYVAIPICGSHESGSKTFSEMFNSILIDCPFFFCDKIKFSWNCLSFVKIDGNVLCFCFLLL